MQRNKKGADKHNNPLLMSLNDINLTNYQLASLYPNVLVEPMGKAGAELYALNYLGGNLSHILLVINKDFTAFLSDAEFTFLTSILGACKLSIADVAIYNWAQQEVPSHTSILAQLKSKKVLLFDLDPTQFGLPLFFQHYQIQSFNNLTFLSAPSLLAIENNVEEKKNFWNALKELFSL
ncbi:MAG: hypothetical protein ABIN57_07745 [Chitinophagaceae bacterium]